MVGRGGALRHGEAHGKCGHPAQGMSQQVLDSGCYLFGHRAVCVTGPPRMQLQQTDNHE